jgi:disulfide bond formation protein DsbB
MTIPIDLVNTGFALFTVAGDALLLFWLCSNVLFREASWAGRARAYEARYAMPFAFFIAFSAMAGSLFYSEVIGYIACTLCWYQRIFMYPQAFILGLALVKRDTSVARYCLLLSVVGTLIAVYHVYLQSGGTALFPCAAIIGAAACSQRFFLLFGYVTIPMMSLTVFGLLIASMATILQQKKPTA